jgi:hypothetical protein
LPHYAHCAAGIVEHPFGTVSVDEYARVGIGGSDMGEDVRDHA